MTDDLVKQALAELGDVVRCHCDEAFRDRGLQDPECNCDSMDAVRVVLARIEALERERREAALDALAAMGQAQEAYEAQLKAEAKVEQLEREAILDAKLLADTQALLDTALEAVIDAKLVAEAKLAEVEAERDATTRLLAAAGDGLRLMARAEAAEAKLAEAVKMLDERDREYNRLTNGMIERHAATVATLTKKMEAMRGAAEEAAEVIHKAYVSATMEAVNAGPSHPLKDNIDKWRVRCLRAEEALRAALTTEKTNG
ncbi:hypothetical protein UFOVP330_15 [uncultured Caudovirales phage]|uniref:Uncharacterized protein n=1 Tax=uncultured Caudovirales phage TaxID=2100421 RepID=A0A6J5LYW2_9CAUD|nr:hypothetical protein UFOVP330_15 [uncultured Caudovirales phage]